MPRNRRHPFVPVAVGQLLLVAYRRHRPTMGVYRLARAVRVSASGRVTGIALIDGTKIPIAEAVNWWAIGTADNPVDGDAAVTAHADTIWYELTDARTAIAPFRRAA